MPSPTSNTPTGKQIYITRAEANAIDDALDGIRGLIESSETYTNNQAISYKNLHSVVKKLGNNRLLDD